MRIVIGPAAVGGTGGDARRSIGLLGTGESPVPTLAFYLAFYLPPWVRDLDSRGEVFFAEGQRLVEIGADESGFFRVRPTAELYRDGQHGREADDVVVPERSANFGQVGFVEEGAVAGRLQIHAADFHVERIFLRRDHEVRAIAAEFAVDLVADVGGDGDHGRRDRYAERDGYTGEKLAPGLSAKRFVDEAREHYFCSK